MVNSNLTLQPYLAGHLAEKALYHFERAFDNLVKNSLQEEYSDVSDEVLEKYRWDLLQRSLSLCEIAYQAEQLATEQSDILLHLMKTDKLGEYSDKANRIHSTLKWISDAQDRAFQDYEAVTYANKILAEAKSFQGNVPLSSPDKKAVKKLQKKLVQVMNKFYVKQRQGSVHAAHCIVKLASEMLPPPGKVIRNRDDLPSAEKLVKPISETIEVLQKVIAAAKKRVESLNAATKLANHEKEVAQKRAEECVSPDKKKAAKEVVTKREKSQQLAEKSYKTQNEELNKLITVLTSVTNMQACWKKVLEQTKELDNEQRTLQQFEPRRDDFPLVTLTDIDKNVPQPPSPLWLRKARETLSRKSASFAEENKCWDTFTLAKVMQGHAQIILEPLYPRDKDRIYHTREQLLNIIRVLEARNKHSKHMATAAESLDLIRFVQQLLQMVHTAKPDEMELAEHHQEVTELFKEATTLVQEARGSKATTFSYKLSQKESDNLLLYRAVLDFETRLRQFSQFTYLDGDIIFQSRALQDEKNIAKKDRMKVASARHAIFHHTGANVDYDDVLTTAKKILQTAANNQPVDWPWVRTTLKEGKAAFEGNGELTLGSTSMRISVQRERTLVGRTDEVKNCIKSLLAGEYSRVLIHGPPGVGKDVVAVEVVSAPPITDHDRLALQVWLLGSTNDILHHQLVDAFKAHRPSVVSASDNQQEILKMIHDYLNENRDEWLFVVEDASKDTDWSWLPIEGGRVLITSQEPLHTWNANITEHSLQGLKTDDCVELLRNMRLFDDIGCTISVAQTEEKLRTQCEGTKGSSMEVEMIDAPADETPAQYKQRYSKLKRSLRDSELKRRCEATNNGVKFEKPDKETASECRQRQRRLAGKLQEFDQFESESNRPKLRSFLENQLGNIPLAVSLFGQVLRSFHSITNVIEEFEKTEIPHLEHKYPNNISETHYLGMTRTVLMLLRRLEFSLSPDQHLQVKSLLSIVCLLSPAETPVWLFNRSSDVLGGNGLVDNVATLCNNSKALNSSRIALMQRGILYESQGVGHVDQMVRRVVVEQLILARCHKPEVKSWLVSLRELLVHHSYGVPFSDPKYRELGPCQREWYNFVEKHPFLREHDADNFLGGCHGAYSKTTYKPQVATKVLQAIAKQQESCIDFRYIRTLQNLGAAMVDDGDYEGAIACVDKALDSIEEARPSGYDIVCLLRDKALAQRRLDKFDEAEKTLNSALEKLENPDCFLHAELLGDYGSVLADLKQTEKAAEFHLKAVKLARQLRTESDPSVINLQARLAGSYRRLGKLDKTTEGSRRNFQLALEKRKSIVESLRKQFNADRSPILHFEKSNLAHSHADLSDFYNALTLHLESLKGLTTWNPNHHRTIAQMACVAGAYSAVSDHENALELYEKVLTRRLEEKEPSHQKLFITYSNCAGELLYLEKYQEAGEILGNNLPELSNACTSAQCQNVITMWEVIVNVKPELRKNLEFWENHAHELKR